MINAQKFYELNRIIAWPLLSSKYIGEDISCLTMIGEDPPGGTGLIGSILRSYLLMTATDLIEFSLPLESTSPNSLARTACILRLLHKFPAILNLILCVYFNLAE